MHLTNTQSQYGVVTKTFHWLTALGIVLVIPLGIIANDMPYDTSEQLADKAWLFSLHKTVGVTVFFVALARIAWAVSQPKPAPLHPDRKAETLLAEIVHWLLYGSLILVPLSGWIHHAATEGFAPVWWPFGQNLPLVPDDAAVAEAFAGLHIVFERVLVISLILHVGGAVKHAVIDKDSTL
ncbi:MAG TPA: cytochrome b/b6 domain-containing protein, partial [Marivita sp.]|nr:cytochrome b/b6 domain-containing protein [Marivita sp.]